MSLSDADMFWQISSTLPCYRQFVYAGISKL